MYLSYGCNSHGGLKKSRFFMLKCRFLDPCPGSPTSPAVMTEDRPFQEAWQLFRSQTFGPSATVDGWNLSYSYYSGSTCMVDPPTSRPGVETPGLQNHPTVLLMATRNPVNSPVEGTVVYPITRFYRSQVQDFWTINSIKGRIAKPNPWYHLPKHRNWTSCYLLEDCGFRRFSLLFCNLVDWNFPCHEPSVEHVDTKLLLSWKTVWLIGISIRVYLDVPGS